MMGIYYWRFLKEWSYVCYVSTVDKRSPSRQKCNPLLGWVIQHDSRSPLMGHPALAKWELD